MKHWLIVPADPEQDLEVVHEGCPSMVTIYLPGEHVGLGLSPLTRPETESQHLCDVAAWWGDAGTCAFDLDFDEVPPGRYAIEAWSEHYPSTPDHGEEWDGGLRITDPYEIPEARSYLYCDHDGGGPDGCTACQDPDDDGPHWPIPSPPAPAPDDRPSD